MTPALFTRTSKELLGGRSLPTVVRDRPVVYILGDRGSGKSAVALRLAPSMAPRYDPDGQRNALILAGRHRRWCALLVESPGLILDGVQGLHRSFGKVRLLGELLRLRAAAGRRTILVLGSADTSMTLLYPEVPCEQSATVLLRFPVGGGRRRFVAERCAARGIRPDLAGGARHLDPWTYAGVESYLDNLG